MQPNVRRFLNRRKFLVRTGLIAYSLAWTVSCSQNVETTDVAAEDTAATEVAASSTEDMPKVRVGF